MKQNRTIEKFLDDNFNKIEVSFKILQKRRMSKNKLFRGYVYVDGLFNLKHDKISFINDNIYPMLVDNGWEILLTNDKFDDVINLFPIYETL